MNASRIIAIVLAGGASIWILSGMLMAQDGNQDSASSPAATAPAGAPHAAVRVRTSIAQEHEDLLRLSGRTEADISVDIRAEIEAPVERIGAIKGQRLRKGDLIAGLAVQDRQARVEKARALVAQRELENSAAKSLAEKNYRSKTGVAETTALLEEARADLKLAQIELAHTEIRAPFDGLIEDRPAEIGDLLSVGDPVATMIRIDPMLVVAQVPEHSVGHIATGQLAHIRLFDGRSADGIVRYVARVADATTRTYRVEVEIENRDLTIPDGMTAELALPVGTRMAHQVAPSVLTLNDAGALGVRSVQDDNGDYRVVFHPVTLQGGDRDAVWIGGLPDRIELITVGQDWVREGAIVDISRNDAANAPASGATRTSETSAAPGNTDGTTAETAPARETVAR